MKENKLSFEELLTKNKLGIEDFKELDKASRIYTSQRTDELLLNPVKGNFNYEHLKSFQQNLKKEQNISY
ncbi:hypothetical protein [Campylobacter canadensis]|uniref:hypothetical protein n=1 Tax=Campylobacter canadensis TaxID=449520 RepID=UPI001552F949|nr:hypothetical protein [Campylobacter canadensis]